MHNTKSGANPFTGREFLILNVDVNRKLTKGDSYQTRYGAEQAKQSGQIIVRADLLEEKKKGWKQATQRAAQKIDEFRNKIAKAKAEPYDGAEKFIEKWNAEIKSLQTKPTYDFSSI